MHSTTGFEKQKGCCTCTPQCESDCCGGSDDYWCGYKGRI